MRQSKPLLPMYRSRFRNDNGPLISAIDICNTSTSEFLDRIHDIQTHPLRSPFQDNRFETFLCRELFLAASELQGLTYILDLYVRQPNRISSIQLEFFEDTFAAVQHALISFPQVFATGNTVIYFRQHCWRLAALIYFNMAIRKWDLASGLVKSFIDQLISALRETDLSSAWASFSDVLLWVLFIGSCGAGAKFERGWLVLEFRRVVRLLGLQSVKDIEELLKSFLYRESIFQRLLCTLLEEIDLEEIDSAEINE